MTSKLFNFLLATALGLTITLLHNPDAYAHKVNMFAYSEGPKIFIEGYFSDGNKAQHSTVTVFDPEGKQLLQGTTDEDGQFSFPIPQKTNLRVVLNAGMGHRTEYVIKASELSDDVAMSSPEQTNKEDSVDESMNESENNSSSSSGLETISNAELHKVVERAVGQAIKPLMREVSEMKEERGFTSIVGGIGFIFGVLGVAFYLKARKEMVHEAKITD